MGPAGVTDLATGCPPQPKPLPVLFVHGHGSGDHYEQNWHDDDGTPSFRGAIEANPGLGIEAYYIAFQDQLPRDDALPTAAQQRLLRLDSSWARRSEARQLAAHRDAVSTAALLFAHDGARDREQAARATYYESGR